MFDERKLYYLNQMDIEPWVMRRDVEKYNQVAKINLDVENCNNCYLRDLRRKSFISCGSSDAKLMFVSDTPNTLDNKSGVLFNNMLQAFGLSMEDIYFTSIVKCCVDESHAPSGESLTTCSSYLRRQIELVKPKLIFTLGVSVAKYLLKEELNTSELINNQLNCNGIPLIASVSPKDILKSPLNKKVIYRDLLNANFILKNYQPDNSGNAANYPESNSSN